MCPVWTVTLLASATVVWKLPWIIYKTGRGAVFQLLFDRSVVSSSLHLHRLQHARHPCPSVSPGVCSDSCALSQWCHPTISSSVSPVSSCPQSFPATGFFSSESALCIRWPKYWRLASASVLPMNIQGWFPLGLTGLILLSKELSRAFSSTTVWKNQFFGTQPSLCSNKTLLIKAGNRPDLTLGL